MISHVEETPNCQIKFESQLDSFLGSGNLSPFTGNHPCLTSSSHVGARIVLEELAYLQVKQEPDAPEHVVFQQRNHH